MPWNPQLYLGFQSHRLRPALDLISAIPELPSERPSIVDLGCGPGHISEHLLGRWPNASYQGVDNSTQMLAQAEQAYPALSWTMGGLEDWSANEPVDLIFANASLHWVDDHEHVVVHWMNQLKPGGVLAVQMPNNFPELSHQCAYRIARTPPFASFLEPNLRMQPVHMPEQYLDWLSPLCKHIDMWQTQYFQVLTGINPVADWIKGSLLVPMFEQLPVELRSDFERQYREAIAKAYPAQANGQTLFPFKRFFWIASKR